MTTPSRRHRRRRQYLSLGAGELVSVVVFALVLPRLLDEPDRAALWAALLPLLVILLQAGGYWLAARRWVGRGTMPAPLAGAYRAFRWLDVALLLGGLAGVLVSRPDRPGVAVLVGLIWLFAVIEYVNYFVVRLAYPPTRWWRTVRQSRTPRLLQDLRGAAAAGLSDSPRPTPKGTTT